MTVFILIAVVVFIAAATTRSVYWANAASKALLLLSALWIGLVAFVVSYSGRGDFFALAFVPPLALIASAKALSWVFRS